RRQYGSSSRARRAGTAPAGKVSGPTLGERAQHALVGAVLGPEPHRRLDVAIPDRLIAGSAQQRGPLGHEVEEFDGG
ncbi:MAG TPA: hypothetical protein VN961_00260, partial [Streptosporangiaceae bacterium]|nr:hypothetical protein [Streptosporangiaceae bacterium]